MWLPLDNVGGSFKKWPFRQNVFISLSILFAVTVLLYELYSSLYEVSPETAYKEHEYTSTRLFVQKPADNQI